MEYREYTGKTVEDAVMEAAIQLETSSDKLEYEVLDKGSSGFLGIGSRPAKIRACKVLDSSAQRHTYCHTTCSKQCSYGSGVDPEGAYREYYQEDSQCDAYEALYKRCDRMLGILPDENVVDELLYLADYPCSYKINYKGCKHFQSESQGLFSKLRQQLVSRSCRDFLHEFGCGMLQVKSILDFCHACRLQ